MSQESETTLRVVTDASTFEKEHSQCPHSVLFFWTSWHNPCKQLEPVLLELSHEYRHLIFYSIDAEVYGDSITSHYQVEAVPTIIFCEMGVEKQRFEAITAPVLVGHLNKFSIQASNAQKLNSAITRSTPTDDGLSKSRMTSINNKNDTTTTTTTTTTTSSSSSEETLEELNARIGRLINSHAMMIFIKGSPNNPKCKFTRAFLEVLQQQGVDSFGYFDILEDNRVREQIKVYSNWSTFPQLYINGKLIGGLDVVKEMVEEGEFADLIPPQCKQKSKTDVVEVSLNDRLKKLITLKPAMLFMKGSPTEPKCGFSEQIVTLLQEKGLKFGHFDVLSDKEVKEGLKQYSDWHTYPQLYVQGKLIGGLDVIRELIDEGEFDEKVLAPSKK